MSKKLFFVYVTICVESQKYFESIVTLVLTHFIDCDTESWRSGIRMGQHARGRPASPGVSWICKQGANTRPK